MGSLVNANIFFIFLSHRLIGQRHYFIKPLKPLMNSTQGEVI